MTHLHADGPHPKQTQTLVMAIPAEPTVYYIAHQSPL